MSSVDGLELDLSQVEGRRFKCLDGCELCCLCQPEVMPHEAGFFRDNYPERLVTVDDAYRHLAIAMREGGGPCSFLKGGRCEIYDNRPRFCRQFPFHLYLGESVQAELDLSCRGVWTDQGDDAIQSVDAIVRENLDELGDMLGQTRSSYSMFWENCRFAGVGCDMEVLRNDLYPMLVEEINMSGLARTLEASADESELGGIERGTPLSSRERSELETAIMESALSSLKSDSPYDAPVYCDPKGRWHLFEVREGEIHWQVMGREGELQYIALIDPLEVRISDTGLVDTRAFREYLGILNGRDSFWGQAFYLEDMYGYEDHLSNTCLGTFVSAALDLLWKTTLLGRAFGMEDGEELMREGLIFYDMERLGAPTIGAFF